MLSFRDIPPFTRSSRYSVDVSWSYLEEQLEDYSEDKLDLDPDFQRAHVWTREQQIAYVEYILRGGISGKDIYFNAPFWGTFNKKPGEYNEFVIVDGKQRLHAVRRFLNNEIPAFDHYRKEYSGRPDMITASFKFHINDLKSKQEVLTWYLEFNTGGTPHTEAELNKVREMLKEEK